MLAALALIAVTASPGPAGHYREGARVLEVAATADPKVFTLADYFVQGDLGPTPMRWDPKQRTLTFEGGGFVLSADGRTLTTANKQYALARLSADEAAKLPRERELRGLATEAKVMLKSLYVAEMALFAEKDAYSTNPAELGYEPAACADGTRAPARKGELAGCLFVLRIALAGTSPETAQFTGTATGVGKAKGLVLTVSSAERGETQRGMVRVEP